MKFLYAVKRLLLSVYDKVYDFLVSCGMLTPKLLFFGVDRYVPGKTAKEHREDIYDAIDWSYKVWMADACPHEWQPASDIGDCASFRLLRNALHASERRTYAERDERLQVESMYQRLKQRADAATVEERLAWCRPFDGGYSGVFSKYAPCEVGKGQRCDA